MKGIKFVTNLWHKIKSFFSRRNKHDLGTYVGKVYPGSPPRHYNRNERRRSHVHVQGDAPRSAGMNGKHVSKATREGVRQQ